MNLTQRNWRKVDRPESAHLAVHFVAPIVLLFAGVLLVDAVLQGTPERDCAYEVTVAPLPAWHIVLVGVGALIVGRYLSLWGQARTYARRQKWSRAIVAGAWFWLFLLLAGVWLYEAVGTAQVPAHATENIAFQPITYYVRCAAYQDFASNGIGLWSMFVVAIVSGLIGHWLWAFHPKGGRRLSPGRSDGR